MHRSVKEFALLMAARSFLDGLDGSVARACHNGTPMGPDIDTALDFLPAILCLHFSWYVAYGVAHPREQEERGRAGKMETEAERTRTRDDATSNPI